MSTSSDEPQEVEAQVIESPSVLTRVDELVGKAAERAASWPTEYVARVPETEGDYRQQRRDRAALRREIKEVEDARRELFRDAKAAIRDGEQRVADVLRDGKAIDQAMADGNAEWERRVVSAHRAEARETWLDLAPEISAEIPFSRVWDHEAEARKWDHAGTNVEAIKRDLEGVARGVADDWQAIAGFGLSDEDAGRLRDLYCQSLDLREAARQAQAERDQREARRRADEEREAREAWEREQAAQADPYVPGESPLPEAVEGDQEARQKPEPPQPVHVPEPVQIAPQEGSQPASAPLDTHSTMSAAEYASWQEATGVAATMPQEAQASPVAPSASQPATWVFAGCGTEAQAQAFAEWCRTAGVSRHTEIPTQGRSYVLHVKRGE